MEELPFEPAEVTTPIESVSKGKKLKVKVSSILILFDLYFACFLADVRCMICIASTLGALRCDNYSMVSNQAYLYHQVRID